MTEADENLYLLRQAQKVAGLINVFVKFLTVD